MYSAATIVPRKARGVRFIVETMTAPPGWWGRGREREREREEVGKEGDGEGIV